MKQIKCEMCGNTDLVKQDGLWVCQFCGAKYTVEEARKLMFDGPVDVSGSTIKIDNSDLLGNYYQMAENAYGSNNHKEAETYCNKVIENDPQNYKAWMLKGKSAGWQSTLGNVRVDEVINCFTNAKNYSPEGDERDRVKKEASQDLERILLALINVCCDNYVKNPSEANTENIISNGKLCLSCCNLILNEWGVPIDDFKKITANKVNESAVNAWIKVILKDYTEDLHPSKYDWERFKERAFNVLKIFQLSIDMSDENLIGKYNSMIIVTQKIINSAGYHYNAYKSKYEVEIMLTNESKEANIDRIMEWHKKIKELNPQYVIPERQKVNYKKHGMVWLVLAVIFIIAVIIIGSVGKFF